MKTVEESKYAKEAGELFMEGYNCAQSVFLAFREFYDLDFDFLFFLDINLSL